MTFGRQIQQLREGRQWTREQLAVFSSLSASTIRRIETNEIRPRPATILALADALGVDAQELANDAGVRLYMPPDKWS